MQGYTSIKLDDSQETDFKKVELTWKNYNSTFSLIW